MDIQGRMTSFAMLGATWVMWLLVGLSIVGLAIVLERAYFMLASRDDIRLLTDDLFRLLKARDVDGARKRLKGSRSFEAKVVMAGLDSVEDGAAAAAQRMARESQLSRLQMERNLAFLGTVGNNAPFVGLLGTVIGVIRAFAALNESQGTVSASLMQEIGEALVATAIGLVVALPAVAAYNIFMRMVKARVARADAMGREVLAFLESGHGGDGRTGGGGGSSAKGAPAKSVDPSPAAAE